MLRHGSYPSQPKPPLTPGYDLVGIVDRGGEGTTATEPTAAAVQPLGCNSPRCDDVRRRLTPCDGLV